MDIQKRSTDGSPLLTREQAGRWLKISTRTLDDMLAEGEIKATRVRRRVFVHVEDLRRYIDAQRQCA